MLLPQDIVYGNWNGPHRLYIQEKDSDSCSKFVDRAPSAMSTPSPIRTVIVADFDNDGYEEIFWNNIPGANRLSIKLRNVHSILSAHIVIRSDP